jgi:Flp pilus assembly protein protease CpaA
MGVLIVIVLLARRRKQPSAPRQRRTVSNSRDTPDPRATPDA